MENWNAGVLGPEKTQHSTPVTPSHRRDRIAFAREVNSIQPKADPPQVEVNLQASAPNPELMLIPAHSSRLRWTYDHLIGYSPPKTAIGGLVRFFQ